MSFQGPRIAQVQAGTLNLSVAYGGRRADELGVDRLWFSYRVEETIGASRGVLTGRDLGASAGGDVTARTMVGALASFLADAGERYRTGMRAPDTSYPRWLYEAAYVNSDELAVLADAPDEPTTSRASEYVSVVFQQGEDADDALGLLVREGPAAALAHLARWDFGDETELAAHADGHVYRQPPAGRDDHTYVDGAYVLSWNPALWHIGLSRTVAPAPAASGAGRGAREPAVVAPAARRVLPPFRQSSVRRPRPHDRPTPGL